MLILKSEFCGLQENDQKVSPMSFGGLEIAKKQSDQSFGGHPVVDLSFWGVKVSLCL